MRRTKNVAAKEEDPVLDISSLIDVCFLLLIYFVVTSTIQPREQDLPMTMPGDPSDVFTLDQPVTALIGIRGDGAVVMNPGENAELLDSDAAKRELPNTKERLQMMNQMAKSSGTELMVQVYAMENVSQQRFVDVLNCLRGEGIEHLTITDVE